MNCDLPTDEIDPKSTHLNRAAHTAAGGGGGGSAAAAKDANSWDLDSCSATHDIT